LPLSWNEIRDRAIQFSREWNDAEKEDKEAKSFLDKFFDVFGVSRRRVATFEEPVKKLDGRDGFIDLLWKGTLLVEFKSKGRDLDKAHVQARDYFPGLKDVELPKYILLCDFDKFRLQNLDTGEEHRFALKDLHKNIKHFGFIAGYETQVYKDQDTANIKAAELMGKLHDELKAIGYDGHDLEVLLVRLLFCLFADDTGIFAATHPFERFIQQRTSGDGSDLAARLSELFEVLNQDEKKRLKNLDDQLNEFPYVNGKLFEERIRTASFTTKMRNQLLDCCAFDWSSISPAIFGALFQSIMDDKARRNLGAHYTSEKNILKLIKPLFLDELREEFEKIRKSVPKLEEFHKKLRSLTFLDPACGCGNFLVITYRELRLLEMDVLRAISKSNQLGLTLSDFVRVNVDQFYGIELEEWPAQIAQVAMWLVDHQMNTMASLEFGQHFARIPLVTSAHIVNDNALRIDWGSVVPKEKLSYILGNPPFVGSKFLTAEQKSDLLAVWAEAKGAGVLDFVTGWYIKAAHFIQGTGIKVAFVSTNSVAQGEQPGIIWPVLFKMGMKIHFAHRTFVWRNEAPGMAAVHCVIIGFAGFDTARKTIFDYSDIKGEPHALSAANVNPYLIDGPDVALQSRQNPLCDVPGIGIGNQPIDGGHYLFTPDQRDDFIKLEPAASKWFRRWIGSDEFLNNYERWCLWLGETSPSELRAMPLAMKRVEAVQAFRKESKRTSTLKLANTPTRFQVENMPKGHYLVIPEVSSERRRYIPIGFEGPETLASNLVKIVPNATLYHLGVLSSEMHMSWVRYTCGRLKSDYRYSKDIVYNNFPWPTTERQKKAIEDAAQAVLDARAQFPNSSLADLYDPLTMPPALLKAHQALDRAVDAAYGKKSFASEADRVAFLFEEYQKLVAPLTSIAIDPMKTSKVRK
jgi:hypothetical protein